MTYQDQKNFTFVSDACPEDTFAVVRFKGTERISGLYEFDITLSSDDPDIDVRSVLRNPATFKIITPDTELPVYGIMARFEQLQEVDEHIFYRGVLVPRFWQSTLAHDNELFLEKNVQGIIEEILAQTGLTSNDYELRLTADYPAWDYICQYQESDFSFVSRRMEREGIYYYYEQSDNGDKLIITDSSTSHEEVPGQVTISYIPPSGLAPSEEDAVRSFICRHQILPANVVLRDYNYRRPTLDLRGEADVDAAGGRGTVYIYGEHFKTPEEGNALARVRAEELLCREQVFYGESTAANLRPGYLFELTGHYRDSYNQRYLILDVSHKGRQTRYLSQGASEDTAAGDQGPGYMNQFSAIPADIQFRPERQTPRPRFNGTMNATIDAAGDGKYAEIDDEGRYKVVLPFDQSGNTEGRASRWVRMSQPYSGANYGMHFPLHKGTEVLLTFVDGDPDRPIIQGSVPNPDTMSPVTGGNQTSSVIRTGGGNQIKIEDNDGSQLIRLDSPTSKTHFRIGATNCNPPGIDMGTAGHYTSNVDGQCQCVVGDFFSEEITGPMTTQCHSDQENLVDGDVTEASTNRNITSRANETRRTQGNRSDWVNGSEEKKVYGISDETFLSVKTSKKLALENELVAGAKISNKLSAEIENVYGVKVGVFAGIKREKTGGLRFKEQPADITKSTSNITLTSGGSTITITPGGININTAQLTITGRVLVDGACRFIKGVSIREDLAVLGDLNVGGDFDNPNFFSPG